MVGWALSNDALKARNCAGFGISMSRVTVKVTVKHAPLELVLGGLYST